MVATLAFRLLTVLRKSLFLPLLFVVIYPPLIVLPLLDLLPMFGKSRRCLHDRAAGTRVVRVNAMNWKT